MNAIIKFVLFASVAKTFAHPYAQLIPFRVVEERVLGQQFDNPSIPATFSAQPEVHSSKNGRSIQPQCPCTARSRSQALLALADNVAPTLPVAEFKILPRAVHSDAETRIPIAESAQVVTPPAVSPFGDPAIRSAIEAVAQFFGFGEVPERKPSVQRETPVDQLEAANPSIYVDTVAKKVQSQNSQIGNSSPEGYGVTYDLRVQTFKSVPDQLEVEPKSKVETEQPKESKPDDQRNEIVDSLEQLLMGQWTLLTQQRDIESMLEREFKNQESFMREIKRLLNLLRKSGSGTAHSESVAGPTPSNTETSYSEEGTMTTSVPDTTSAAAPTTAKSAMSVEN